VEASTAERWRGWLSRVALLVQSLFIVPTLGAVGWLLIDAIREPEAVQAVFTHADRSSVLLTYRGTPGVVLGGAQVVVVGGSLVLALIGRGARLRLGSLGVLVAWSALWTANAGWLLAISGPAGDVFWAPLGGGVVGVASAGWLLWRDLRACQSGRLGARDAGSRLMRRASDRESG